MNRRQFQSAAFLATLSACSIFKRPTTMYAIDCHAHVFLHNLPMPDKRRAPSGYDAPPEQFLALQDASNHRDGGRSRVAGIVDQVDEYLLEALDMAHHRRQVAGRR